MTDAPKVPERLYFMPEDLHDFMTVGNSLDLAMSIKREDVAEIEYLSPAEVEKKMKEAYRQGYLDYRRTSPGAGPEDAIMEAAVDSGCAAFLKREGRI